MNCKHVIDLWDMTEFKVEDKIGVAWLDTMVATVTQSQLTDMTY